MDAVEPRIQRFDVPSGPALFVERGDLTRVSVDAIVNAANPVMLGGGGVDGAIHKAAGPRLVEACRMVPKDELGRRCPPGEARITPGFDLPAPWVIHTVGPVFRRDPDPPGTLRAAHIACLELATAQGLRSVAFPAISCGAYGFPLEQAAVIALAACRDAGQSLETIRFVHFTGASYAAWETAAKQMFGPPAPPG